MFTIRIVLFMIGLALIPKLFGLGMSVVNELLNIVTVKVQSFTNKKPTNKK